MGGANPKGGGANLLYDQNCPKDCAKTKGIDLTGWREEGGRGTWSFPPLKSTNAVLYFYVPHPIRKNVTYFLSVCSSFKTKTFQKLIV